VDQALITVWPFPQEILLLIVLCKVLLCHLVVEENGIRSFECILARDECAFDFGVLDAADAIGVVVDCGLENCAEKIVSFDSSSEQNSECLP
jgi:hypothetical protein